MSAFLNLIKGLITSNPKEITKRMLVKFHINSIQALPSNYTEQLILQKHTECSSSQIFGQLLNQLEEANNPEVIVKLITMIFSMLRISDYNQVYMNVLETVQIPALLKSKEDQLSWLEGLSGCLVAYLAKMPSLVGVYHRALTCKSQPSESFQTIQTDFFLLLNQLSLLFPHLNNSMNSIGRYYKHNNPYFDQFYRTIRIEILVGQNYLKVLVDKFMSEYKMMEKQDVYCFLNSIPEVELLCDQLDEFVMNKYFKGKSPTKKIYFKEEDINEILYYLQIQNDEKKDQDMIKTAESQGFGVSRFS